MKMRAPEPPITLADVEWRIAHVYATEHRAAHSSLWRRVLADLRWLVEQVKEQGQ